MRISLKVRRLARSRSGFLISSALGLVLGACDAPELPGDAGAGLVRTAASDPHGYQAARASADYTLTPVALVHRDCLVEVPAETTVDQTGALIYPDGRTEPLAPCEHPTYLSNSEESGPASRVAAAVTSSTSVVTDIPGGANAAWLSDTWLSRLVENVTVPADPTTKGGTLQFSVSLSSRFDGGTSILKPALEWDGTRWKLGTYYTWGAGKVVKASSGAAVKPGDSLWAGIEASRCASDGTHCTWKVTMRNRRTWEIVHIDVISYDYFRVAVGGSLDFPKLASCAMLPANGSITFSGLQLVDGKGQRQVPNPSESWTILPCQLGVSDTESSTTIRWSPR